MKKIVPIIVSFLVITACKKEINLKFSESNSVYNINAIVEINIPKAEGENTVSFAINSKIENHIANALNFSEDHSDSLNLNDAVVKFDDEYSEFKNEFEESSLIWEALFDGEVIYQSAEIICVAINGYTNTGGAHGNMNITLYNFDAQTGEVIENADLITDMEGFTKIIKANFKKEIDIDGESEFGDFFFGDDFHLPANIGFTDEGLLILYNVYEIASYAQGITEFTIPFDEIDRFIIDY
jgi:hypothetical protein